MRPGVEHLVLVTSRRRLIALEDAAVISLGTLSPDEAAVLLARLAGRGDLRSGLGPAGQSVLPSEFELGNLCRPESSSQAEGRFP